MLNTYRNVCGFLVVALLATGAAAQSVLHSEDFESYADGELVESQNDWTRGQFNSGKHGTPDAAYVQESISHDGSNAMANGWGPGVGNSTAKLIDPSWIVDGQFTALGDFKVNSGWVRFAVGPASTITSTEDLGAHTKIWLNYDNRGHYTEARIWNAVDKDGSDVGFETTIVPTSLSIPGVGQASSTGWAQWRFAVDMSGNATNGNYTIEMRPLNNSADNSHVPWTMLRDYTDGLDTDFEAFGVYGQASNWAWDNIQIVGGSSASFAGDFDGDGDVDGDDFLSWQNNFPTASGATKSGGDADGDGDVDGDDFLVWQNQFPSPGAVAATPEPASLALLGLGGLMMLRRRR